VPAWSPDGSKLVVTRAVLGVGVENSDLYLLDVATGVSTQLTARPQVDISPDWSPDGRHIAFSSHEPGPRFGNGVDTNVYVVDVQTGEVVQLTDRAGRDSNPRWSPDGGHIAFNREGDIAIMKPRGRGFKNITDAPVASHLSPDWSADGSRIAYSGGAHIVRLDDTPDTYVIDSDGGNRHRIQAHPWAMLAPRWLYARSLRVNPFGLRGTMLGRLKRLGS